MKIRHPIKKTIDDLEILSPRTKHFFPYTFSRIIKNNGNILGLNILDLNILCLATLRQRCTNVAAILQERCCNTDVTLQQYCKDVAVQYCRYVAAIMLCPPSGMLRGNVAATSQQRYAVTMHQGKVAATFRQRCRNEVYSMGGFLQFCIIYRLAGFASEQMCTQGIRKRKQERYVFAKVIAMSVRCRIGYVRNAQYDEQRVNVYYTLAE